MLRFIFTMTGFQIRSCLDVLGSSLEAMGMVGWLCQHHDMIICARGTHPAFVSLSLVIFLLSHFSLWAPCCAHPLAPRIVVVTLYYPFGGEVGCLRGCRTLSIATLVLPIHLFSSQKYFDVFL